MIRPQAARRAARRPPAAQRPQCAENLLLPGNFANIREFSGKEACEEKLLTYVQHSNRKVLKYKKIANAS